MLQRVYATPIPSVRLSVCHTCVLYQKAERIIEILSLSNRPIILVFRHQGSLCKSEGVTPNRGAKYNGGIDFRPICGYISETVRDRGTITMKDVLYRIVPFSMTLSDPEPQFQGHTIV